MSSGGGLVKIAGVDKAVLRDFYDIEVEPDVWEEFVSRRNGALLGTDLVRDGDLTNRYVWEKGKEFAMADFNGLTLYMAGTYKPRDPTLTSVIITGDIFLQEVDDRRGVANQILVRVRHRDDAPGVVQGIQDLGFPVPLQPQSQQVALDQAVADLDEMLRYAAHVMLAVGIVIFIGLANATSMAVRERTREVGVLRSLGYSRTRIVMLIAAESFGLTLLGGLLGCAAAVLVVQTAGATVNVGSYGFPIDVSVPLVVLAALASSAVGILGGLPAGIQASRRPIVLALRSVD